MKKQIMIDGQSFATFFFKNPLLEDYHRQVTSWRNVSSVNFTVEGEEVALLQKENRRWEVWIDGIKRAFGKVNDALEYIGAQVGGEFVKERTDIEKFYLKAWEAKHRTRLIELGWEFLT